MIKITYYYKPGTCISVGAGKLGNPFIGVSRRGIKSALKKYQLENTQEC